MHVLCCHPDLCSAIRGPSVFERIIYCVKIERPLFDLFFNSFSGYRAAYFRSPYEGLRANAEALATLSPLLIPSPKTAGQMPENFIEESLGIAFCESLACRTGHLENVWSATASGQTRRTTWLIYRTIDGNSPLAAMLDMAERHRILRSCAFSAHSSAPIITNSCRKGSAIERGICTSRGGPRNRCARRVPRGRSRSRADTRPSTRRFATLACRRGRDRRGAGRSCQGASSAKTRRPQCRGTARRGAAPCS